MFKSWESSLKYANKLRVLNNTLLLAIWLTVSFFFACERWSIFRELYHYDKENDHSMKKYMIIYLIEWTISHKKTFTFIVKTTTVFPPCYATKKKQQQHILRTCSLQNINDFLLFQNWFMLCRLKLEIYINWLTKQKQIIKNICLVVNNIKCLYR
jgi:hypothetical protein